MMTSSVTSRHPNIAQQTRSLAREQFLKKALVKKIAKGMALDEYQMR
jgi:hypothetical protein